MRTLALRGWTRQLFAKLHRWTGLALLVFLVIAGGTGTWLAFRHELDRAINPHLRVVVPGPVQVPLSEIYARVEQRYPNTKVTTAVLQERPDDALVIYLRSTTGVRLPVSQIYVNPYNGEILGQRSTRLALTKESIDPFLLRLHYSLLAERPGLILMGVVASVWFITSFIGLALSWPHAWRRLVAWIPMLSVRMNGGAYKVNYDLHRAIGVGLLPVMIVLAFSSITLNLPEVVRPVVNALSPTAPRPVRTSYPLDGPVVTPEAAVTRAVSAVGGGRVSSIYADYGRGWYSVMLQKEGDVAPYGDHYAYIDLASGDVASVRLPSTASAGERFLAWQFPLHTGLAFGRIGQIVIAVTGLAIVVLSVTGFYVWWRKWRERRTAHGRAVAARTRHQAADRRDARAVARERAVLHP